MGRKGLEIKRTWGGKEKLISLIKAEKDSRVKERLQAVLWRLEKNSYTDIADRLKRRKNTVSDWIKRWNKGGYEGILDCPKPGATPKLTQEQEKEVIEAVNKSARITCKILKFKIQKDYGKEFSLRGVNAMLHRHNLSWKKPKKKDYRQNEHKRKEYQKSLKKNKKA